MDKDTLIEQTQPEDSVPEIVISRLPLYLRALSYLEAENKEVTSSQELGQKLGISSAQIRKDLSHFGEFGKQGTGYRINYLKERLIDILNLNKQWPVALIGFGDLGHAIVHYSGFVDKGFHIEAIFDTDPQKVGQRVNNVIIKHSSQMIDSIRQDQIKVAIIAIPMQFAQGAADKLVQAGIKAILNYAPVNLLVPDDVQVQYIDPVAHLQKMTYYL